MKNHAFSSPSLRRLRSPLALLLLLAVAGALLFSPAPAVQAQATESTGTPGSSITVVVETITSGKRVTVSWTDAGTCATTSSYNAYLHTGFFYIALGITETPVEGTSSYSGSTSAATFSTDEVQLWCGTRTSGRLVAEIDGLNSGAPGTYTHSVPDPADAALSALTLSLTGADATPVALTPEFGPDVTAYTAMALADTVVVTPTARNASATFAVKVGGVGGYAKDELPLAEGANTVTVEVTADDGVTMQTYTVTVTRLVEVWSTTVTAGDNTYGTGFVTSGTGVGTGSMTDADERFTFLSVEYRVWMVGFAKVGQAAAVQNRRAIYLSPIIPADAHPNWALVMDGTVYDFADTPATPTWDSASFFSYSYTWAGDNPFADGDTFDVVIASKVALPSSDATLSALGLSAGTLKPPFAAGTTTYTASVANSAASVTVTATKNHADAADLVIKKGATEYANGTVPLDVGDNAITVEVTAEDGVTTETYTVTVTRAEASAARLETLSVANAAGGAALTLTPVFAAETMEYNGSPAYPVSLVTVTATAASGTTVAFEDGAGAALTDAGGATGFQAALVPGENVIKVKVTKGGASAHYTLTLIRAKAQVLITAALAPAVPEGTALVFRVSRRAAAADTLAVTVSVSEDGAMVDDALETASTVTIAANQTSADLTVQTDANDAAWEEHSTVTASTQPGDLYVQAQPAMAQIEVRDDDFPAAFALLGVNTTVAEDAGTLDFHVQVETNGDTQPHRLVALTVATRSGTAASPGDFVAASHNLSLPAGSFKRQSNGKWRVRISLDTEIVDDAVHEPDEQFTLSLGAPPTKPAALAVFSSPSTVTILDDDTPMLLVSNVRQGPEERILTTANAEFAQGFTTGAADDGYTLGSVGLYLPSAPGSAALTVSLRAADGDNPSTTVLHTLTNPQTFVIGTNYFAAPANTVLAKDTPYFVVVSGSAAFSLGIVDSDGEDSGGAAGWSIADRARAAQSGAWGEHNTDDNLAVSVRGEEFVSNDATLSALTLSAGTLAPPFAADTATYTADVTNDVAGVTVTATKNHADATAVIKLGGTADADGTVALAVGDNVITVEVTAEDGVTTETYTITVTRAETADSTGTAGSSITVLVEIISIGKRATVSWTDGGTCATTSSYNVYGYFASTDSTAFVNLMETPVAGTNSYSISKRFTSFGADELQLWCGTPVSGRLVAKVAGLNAGAAGAYTHSVPSSDATLSALSLSAGPSKPTFAAGTTTYTADVVNSVAQVTVTATKNHADATAPVIKLGGTADADGTVALAVGDNVITVEVTAEDGVTTETYTITVTRAAAVADSTGTAGSSITVVIEDLTGGSKRVTVSWTDEGTCATTSSYNTYAYYASADYTGSLNLTATPVEGTSSYSKSKDLTTFSADEVSIWCGTPASGRLVAKVAGLNAATAGTYTHSVPASAVTEVNADLSVAQPSGYTLGVTWTDASACDDDYSIYTDIVGSPGAGTLRGAVDGVPPEFYLYLKGVASGGLDVSVWCGDSATGRELGSADVDPGEADAAVAVATADRGSGLVQISRSDEPHIVASGAFEVRFAFANGVGPGGSAVSATEFQLADIRVVNGAASGLEQAHKNPDFAGVIWKATITPATLGESVLVHLPAGSVMGGPDQDHPNKAGSLHVPTATDTTAPVVTLKLYDASPCRVTGARNFAVIFDDPMNDADPLVATDFTVVNGQVVALRDVYISSNGQDWQRVTVVTVVPQVTSRQTVSVALRAGVVANKAGLTNAAASLSFQADPDNCPPRVSSVGISKQTETTWWVSFYFNEPVLGFAHIDVALGEFASWLQTDHYGLWNEAHSNSHRFLLEYAAANSLELSVPVGAFSDGNNPSTEPFIHTFTPPLAEPPLFKPPLRTWLRDRPDGMTGRQLVVTWQDDSCTTTYQVAQSLNNAWAVLGSGTDLAAPATQYITHNFDTAESSKLVRLVCGTTAQAASGAQQISALAQATAQYRPPASAQQGASPAPAAPRGAAVGIADAALRSALEAALDKKAGALITPQEMAGLTSLDLRGTGVADLTGLEHAVNLAELYLDGLDMDLAPLDGLKVVVYVSPPPLPDPPSSSDDATLSGLALSGAPLASAFDADTTAYAASVANDVAETTVTPTVNDDGATYVIKLDGVADADGTVSLSVGENVVSIEVTAEDGETKKTYTVTVTRAAPPAPGPSVTIALSPSGAVEPGTAITVTMSFGGLEFDSDKATRDYVFRADVLDSDNGDADGCEDRKNGYGLGVERYMWKVDQDPEVRRGATSAGCPAGDYTVRASIASPDNVELASASAGFSVVEPEPTLSGDATLDSLALSGVTLAFDPAVTGYTAEVANSVTETTVTPAVNHVGATYAVQLDGQVDADGTVGLAVGENVINVVVTAEDGETTRTYTVTVTRAAVPLSTDATLRSLTLSGVTLAFDPATTGYTASVGNDVTETTATPAVNHDGATYAVQLDGQVDADGTVPLSVGENVVAIVVTAEDGKTTRTYTVAVTRAAPQLSTDAALRSLTLSGLTLAFDPATSAYTASVGNDVDQTTVTAAVNDDGATYAIKLDGVADADGVVPLSVGANAISIEVTAEDGNTTRTYTVTVTRAAPPLSTDSTLSSLVLSGVNIGAFDPATVAYTASVANDVTETAVTPAVNHDGATYAVQLDGQVDADGTVPLSVGENVVAIVVTAEDGKTTRTYTVAVTRAAPQLSTDAALRSLTLSGLTLAFDPAVTGYTAQVANDVTETTVTPAVNHDGATYVVQLDGQVDADGTVPLSVGENVVAIVVTAEDGKTTRTYTVTVTRAEPTLSADATLRSLALSGVTLAFDPATTGYTAQVANDVDQTTVTPTTNHDGAAYVVQVDGAADADGVIPLAVGRNPISVVVTAEDGETTRTYTVTVTRAAVPPATPDRPAGQSTGEGAVSLDWNDVPTATSYDVRFWQVDAHTELSADASVNGISIAFNGSGATVRGLPTDYEWYFFEVRAVNDAGASGWSPYNAIEVPKDEQIPAPDAPDRPTGRLTGEGAVSLDWNDVPTATSYIVTVWLDDGWTDLSADASVQGVSITFNGSGATVRGLPTDYEWYYFVVRAVNAGGISDWSDYNAIQVQ